MFRGIFVVCLLLLSACDSSPYVETETKVERSSDKETVEYEVDVDDDGSETLDAVKDMFSDPYKKDKY